MPKTSSDDAFIEKIREEKPFQYIVQNLENTFGAPELKKKSDPLAMLINIILSQATSDANSDRTFKNLKARYPRWEDVLAADDAEIAETIRLGGLANQKSKVIKDLLGQIKAKHGDLSLRFLDEMPDAAARDYLLQFRGIGPKT